MCWTVCSVSRCSRAPWTCMFLTNNLPRITLCKPPLRVLYTGVFSPSPWPFLVRTTSHEVASLEEMPSIARTHEQQYSHLIQAIFFSLHSSFHPSPAQSFAGPRM